MPSHACPLRFVAALWKPVPPGFFLYAWRDRELDRRPGSPARVGGSGCWARRLRCSRLRTDDRAARSRGAALRWTAEGGCRYVNLWRRASFCGLSAIGLARAMIVGTVSAFFITTLGSSIGTAHVERGFFDDLAQRVEMLEGFFGGGVAEDYGELFASAAEGLAVASYFG